MSTVLRPVGPHEPRTYWIRRGVLLGIIFVIILLLATMCGGGGGGGGGNNTGGNHPSTPGPTQTPKPVVAACDPAQLKLTVSTDTTAYKVGQAPNLIGTFANPTGPTCKLARSVDNEIWTIKSGPPTVWSTDGCPGDPVPSNLKLAQGATKIVHIFWNGHLRTSSCTETDFAQAGTYTLHATLDGVTAPRAAVFHITS